MVTLNTGDEVKILNIYNNTNSYDSRNNHGSFNDSINNIGIILSVEKDYTYLVEIYNSEMCSKNKENLRLFYSSNSLEYIKSKIYELW